MLKLLAFDVVNTLGKIDKIPELELRNYQSQINRNRVQTWAPFNFSGDWVWMDPFEDTLSGIERLKKNFYCVSFSNMPAWCQMRLFRNWNLNMDGITPLEAFKVSKPTKHAYKEPPKLWGFPTEQIGIVTANRTFGDLEGAKWNGMRPLLIRDDLSQWKMLHDLANYLEDELNPKQEPNP